MLYPLPPPGPRVALVFPVRTRADSFFGFVMPSLGLERLGAAIEDFATVELFDARFERDLIAAVVAMRPDVIAVNVKTTMRCRESYAVADQLRAALPHVTIVLGGLHAGSAPFEALEHGDLVVRGEGEEAFRRIVAGDPPAEIPGVAWRGPAGPVLNPPGTSDRDLDRLRPPARHLRKPHYAYVAAGAGFKVDLLETSRGCTHACSFCSPAAMYPHQYRVHSPAYVLDEIRRLDQAGVKYVMVTDDQLGGDLARLEQLSDLIVASGIRMAFFCFIRAFTGHLALKRKMVEAGFVMVSFGAENPSKAQLQRYGKGYPTDSGAFLRQVNAEWLEAGACYVGNSYVFGDPQDSRETLESLGAYARRLDPTFIEPIYAQPYPNTRYRAELEAAGQLSDRDWPDYTEGRLLVHHPELDEEALRRLRATMWVDFFSPRKAAMGALLVPLYFRNHLGIGLIPVLRYMQATAYAIGGCILEEKFYADLYVEMIHDWFRRALPTFEPTELDMTPHADAFAEMLGLGPLKRLVGTLDLVADVADASTIRASLVCSLAAGRVSQAHVTVGPAPRRDGVRRVAVTLPLGLLAQAIGDPRRSHRWRAGLALVANVLLADLPRRWFARGEGAPTVSVQG